MHEVEHVAREIAAEAVKELLVEVNTTAWPLVVVEGAADLDLIALADRCETIVRKDYAEVRTSFELVKVDAW